MILMNIIMGICVTILSIMVFVLFEEFEKLQKENKGLSKRIEEIEGMSIFWSKTISTKNGAIVLPQEVIDELEAKAEELRASTADKDWNDRNSFPTP